MTECSVVIIEEIGGQGRSVYLPGPAGPFAGAEWRTMMQLVTDWNPGNGTEATQQVIGPREMPSSWEGVWRRNLLVRTPATAITDTNGASTQVTQPTDLVTYLDALFFEGPRLRVTWQASKTELNTNGNAPTTFNYKVVREGRAKDWAFPHDRVDDVHWKITFEWVGRGGSQQKNVSTRDTDPTVLTNTISAGINDFQQSYGPTGSFFSSDPLTPYSATPYTLGQLEALDPETVSNVQGLSTSLGTIQARGAQAANLAQQLDYTPYQLSNNVVDIGTTTILTVNGYRDTNDGIPFESVTLSDNALDLARAALFTANVQEAARVLSRQAADARTRALALASTNPGGGIKSGAQTLSTGQGAVLAVYQTREGDTPPRIARMFYGDPDASVDLLKANHLPWSTPVLPTGTILIIPVLTTSTGV